MASYNSTCCITGINNSDFLIAGHILPWSENLENRLNPQNGILINALHDKAFEYGYLTISEDFKILICNDILKSNKQFNKKYFIKYHEKEMILPSRFLPNKEFLKAHYNEKFRH